ncbi:SLAC1 anion channel family protein [Actinotalea sp. K2]|uniref:SLAC1 anion channel family protein n=1 Tax=Actinotalea sp. K2 TaxID=2939438 RepID=UPI0020178DC6|nr:SLAC1 anion channel family protein [Actinotalea sp. K2]MCL3860072.1 SLAC1 anion channel family protein [Actinotalea sp. K2]
MGETASRPRGGGPATADVEPEGGSRAARLSHLPVTFFATIMGFAGLALAWLRAAPVLGAPLVVGQALFWVALTACGLVLLAYLAKVIRHPVAVRIELHHPVRLAFVPTSTIALLLLATAGQDFAPGLAAVLWWFGAVGQLVLTLYVLSAWISRPVFGMQHVTPAWFIPVVGMVAVPLAGVTFGPVELSWFFFSAGLVFWAALLPMVLTRLFVHEQPVPDQLLPTLAVLIAPPAVAFLSYLRLAGGGLDTASRVLYYTAAFFALLFVTQVGRLRRLPFFLSWWAYAFPLAGLSVATTAMAREVGGGFLSAAAWVLLAVISSLVTLLTVRTVAAIARGQICVPE